MYPSACGIPVLEILCIADSSEEDQGSFVEILAFVSDEIWKTGFDFKGVKFLFYYG